MTEYLGLSELTPYQVSAIIKEHRQNDVVITYPSFSHHFEQNDEKMMTK